MGPYPIFCRGHSGGRLVCEAFIRNQIEMGVVSAEQKDTKFFTIHNPLVRELILQAYHYLQCPPTEKLYFQALMKRCLTKYHQQQIQSASPFGWKMGVSLFLMPMVLDTFPQAKIIHLIRDGRDVMLSRLEARFGENNLADPVNKLVVFGDASVEQFAGQPLTPTTIATYRNELEMTHWVTAVNYGLIGRAYTGRYLEIKYETLCHQPIEIFSQIFDFIEVPFLTSTKQWLQQAVHPNRIGKWRSLPAAQLEQPLQIGEKLLKELAYW